MQSASPPAPTRVVIALALIVAVLPLRAALDVLSAHRGARLHLRPRGRRPEPADGLRRTGQPRPCGLLRHRRLRGRGRTDASRHSVLAAFIVGVAIAGLLAFVVGRPILRLKGHYLAVATLGMGILIAMVFTNEARLTGGPDGMPVPRLELFGWRARTPIAWYWISGVTLVIARADRRQPDREPDRPRLPRHPRQRDRRARARHRRRALQARAFVLSAIYAAVAGAYLALFDALVTPATAGFLRSIEFVTMAVLGGLGSIFGSIVGAAVLVLLPQVLTVFHDYEHIMLGLMMMVFMIFLPQASCHRWRACCSGGALECAGYRGRSDRVRRRDRGRRACRSRSSRARSSPSSDRTARARPRCSTLFPAFTRPRAGAYGLGGDDVTGLAPHLLAQRGLSRTFQNLQIFFRMTAAENVMVGRHLHERRNRSAASLRPAVRVAAEPRNARQGRRASRVRRPRRVRGPACRANCLMAR